MRGAPTAIAHMHLTCMLWRASCASCASCLWCLLSRVSPTHAIRVGGVCHQLVSPTYLYLCHQPVCHRPPPLSHRCVAETWTLDPGIWTPDPGPPPPSPGARPDPGPWTLDLPPLSPSAWRTSPSCARSSARPSAKTTMTRARAGPRTRSARTTKRSCTARAPPRVASAKCSSPRVTRTSCEPRMELRRGGVKAREGERLAPCSERYGVRYGVGIPSPQRASPAPQVISMARV